jgi:hypothetical protein
MGGNSSDPTHPSGTDFKTRTPDEHIHEEDKQALKAHPRSDSKIPTGEENPALEELKERLDEKETN